MEKIWKDALRSEYKKCFDILNTESLIERDTYRKFAIELFEVAKKQLGCEECKLKFIDDERNNLGFSSAMDNSVTLNLRKMEKHSLYKTVSTIYHELTHLRQSKVEDKKKIDTAVPAEFPFIRCYGDDKFLPAEMLGVNPFFFYYTCRNEKQARDVGSECAMEAFVELKNIAETQPTKNGTIRLIERCIQQVKTRWDKENADNSFASEKINEFIDKNPNFVHDAFDKIKQEFLNDAGHCSLISQERLQCEKRFNVRMGSLVLLGCDDKLKNDILSFVASNFISQNEVFVALISVVDSPYSKISKDELSLLFKCAAQNNCPKEVLLNYLISWDKNYVNEVINGSSGKNKNNDMPVNGNNFEL